ncbi:hypothetical protein Y032_0001g199 [Ancylostoma ceylanicum]|uniref:Uncharacterized protein n=1 Tax=Ancylostoma ceylanicum TaxID=53326 RepID=A0A016W303_9BILA|nr:hypothetical protein Y032_0001g199 [Ancylostoma ceylanicum]
MDIFLQVLCMASCELVFFLYWEFVPFEVNDIWDAVIAEISNLLHYDVLLIPYLLMNKQIQSQLKNMWRKHIVHVAPVSGVKRSVQVQLSLVTEYRS